MEDDILPILGHFEGNQEDSSDSGCISRLYQVRSILYIRKNIPDVLSPVSEGGLGWRNQYFVL